MVCVQRSTLERDIDIVVYMGGCCGDLACALIDPTQASFNTLAGSVILPPERQRLKKHFLFPNDQHKDNYLEKMSMMYDSVPSHDLDYHVRREHRFIGILVRDHTTALWAATRFKHIHRPSVWESVQKSHSIYNVKQYAQMMLDYSNLLFDCTDIVVDLKDIVQGRALTVMSELTGHTFDIHAEDFYNNWLEMQQNDANNQFDTPS